MNESAIIPLIQSAGSGTDLQNNPQHFSISIYTNPIMIDFVVALLTEYRWSSITGLVDLWSLGNSGLPLGLSTLNRGMRTQFQALFTGADTTSAYKSIRYYDLQYNANLGSLEMERVLRKMSEVSRSKDA